MNKIQQIQSILGVKTDGEWGPKSQKALDDLVRPPVAPTGDGLRRTDWRGFVEVDENAFCDVLPEEGKFLARSFLAYARQFDLNVLFLTAISRHETAAWTSTAFKTKKNAMGISDAIGPVTFKSHDASIFRMASVLGSRSSYYAKCKTLEDVAAVYAPVGAGNDPKKLNGFWPKQVAKYWRELEAALV